MKSSNQESNSAGLPPRLPSPPPDSLASLLGYNTAIPMAPGDLSPPSWHLNPEMGRKSLQEIISEALDIVSESMVEETSEGTSRRTHSPAVLRDDDFPRASSRGHNRQ